ncbi:MAG: transmembrane(s)protein [candidate division WS6 bacterium 34_10]|uniref:Transmembrane(S)protein n=1 Tax=candidate division WS6 bacterium 34_10 TaxID=1641389 RepID=A0A124FX08_9BACT|nr:MAG: transmembrane(s)protein [candidate division WS6 bacterium 34_10]
MNSKTALITIWICIFTILFPVFSTLAEELDSTNYKILDVTTQGGGTAESDNFSTLMTVNDAVIDPSLYSTNYKLYGDPANAFRPAVPTVSCFETNTDGYSNCTTGPTELTEGGMVALCGSSGCYDRARFEIGDSPYRYDTSPSDIVVYWPMDEVSGTIVDDVKNSNDGTVTGTTIVDGYSNNARSFPGNSIVDYVEKNSFATFPTTAITTSFWVKTADTNGDGMISYASTGSDNDWLIFNSSNVAIYRGSTVSTGVSVNDNQWHHLVVTWQSSNGETKLYLDGSLEYTGTLSTGTSITSGGTLMLAQEQDSVGGGLTVAQSFGGILDEVIIFSTVLDSTEVNGLYLATQSYINPSDTLYAVEISTDNFVSDIRYIDGSTNEPKNDLTLNDFRTKTTWEADTFNILGLQEGTEYSIRIIALHGDFTQTEEGPPASATTGGASSSFDIDIADNSGYTVETDPPFNITFTGENALLAGAGSVIADNLVWMDAETNGSGGFAIVQRGQNGGLYSSTLSTQINSVNGNLDSLSEGFGLQNYYIDYATGTGLGTITAETNYSGSASNVGIVDTDWNKVYDSNGPTVSGRMALYLMARASSDKQGATDYEESITFILVPRY